MDVILSTYLSLLQDFYWRNLAKHVRNWVRRCPQCIRFKSTQVAHGPMHVRALGVDYIGELPQSLHGNKWILTAVRSYSNFLRAIPVPDKTAKTAANALFHNILFVFGFPSVLQSDRGGEWLNALLDHLTKLLSIKKFLRPHSVLV